MLNTIKEIFLGLIGVVESLLGFVVGLIQDFAYVTTLCMKFLVNIPKYFAWLPSEAIVLLVTVFSIVVLYKVMGRE